MLSEGPEVSLRGSPTVTAALCGLEPFGPSDAACGVVPAYKHQNNVRVISKSQKDKMQ